MPVSKIESGEKSKNANEARETAEKKFMQERLTLGEKSLEQVSIFYIVQPGDTLSKIAPEYVNQKGINLTAEELYAFNKDSLQGSINLIYPNEILRIPPGFVSSFQMKKKEDETDRSSQKVEMSQPPLKETVLPKEEIEEEKYEESKFSAEIAPYGQTKKIKTKKNTFENNGSEFEVFESPDGSVYFPRQIGNETQYFKKDDLFLKRPLPNSDIVIYKSLDWKHSYLSDKEEVDVQRWGGKYFFSKDLDSSMARVYQSFDGSEYFILRANSENICPVKPVKFRKKNLYQSLEDKRYYFDERGNRFDTRWQKFVNNTGVGSYSDVFESGKTQTVITSELTKDLRLQASANSLENSLGLTYNKSIDFKNLQENSKLRKKLAKKLKIPAEKLSDAEFLPAIQFHALSLYRGGKIDESVLPQLGFHIHSNGTVRLPVGILNIDMSAGGNLAVDKKLLKDPKFKIFPSVKMTSKAFTLISELGYQSAQLKIGNGKIRGILGVNRMGGSISPTVGAEIMKRSGRGFRVVGGNGTLEFGSSSEIYGDVSNRTALSFNPKNILSFNNFHRVALQNPGKLETVAGGNVIAYLQLGRGEKSRFDFQYVEKSEAVQALTDRCNKAFQQIENQVGDIAGMFFSNVFLRKITKPAQLQKFAKNLEEIAPVLTQEKLKRRGVESLIFGNLNEKGKNIYNAQTQDLVIGNVATLADDLEKGTLQRKKSAENNYQCENSELKSILETYNVQILGAEKLSKTEKSGLENLVWIAIQADGDRLRNKNIQIKSRIGGKLKEIFRGKMAETDIDIPRNCLESFARGELRNQTDNFAQIFHGDELETSSESQKVAETFVKKFRELGNTPDGISEIQFVTEAAFQQKISSAFAKASADKTEIYTKKTKRFARNGEKLLINVDKIHEKNPLRGIGKVLDEDVIRIANALKNQTNAANRMTEVAKVSGEKTAIFSQLRPGNRPKEIKKYGEFTGLELSYQLSDVYQKTTEPTWEGEKITDEFKIFRGKNETGVEVRCLLVTLEDSQKLVLIPVTDENLKKELPAVAAMLDLKAFWEAFPPVPEMEKAADEPLVATNK